MIVDKNQACSVNSDAFRWVSNRTLLGVVTEYVSKSVRLDSHGIRLWDEELGDFASDCVAVQCAGFLNRLANLACTDLSSLAAGLLIGVYVRRKESDWFSIPYNSKLGTRGEVDVAEFGACSHSLRSFLGGSLNGVAQAIAVDAAVHIRELAVSGRPGQYKKSQLAGDLDVPNANIYAALVLDTADRFTHDQRAKAEVQAVLQRLDGQLGIDQADRWPYSLNGDGSTKMGYSTAYQATIVGWGWILASSLGGEGREQWTDTLLKAVSALKTDLDIGPCPQTESASWATTWPNVWEIRLAMAHESALFDEELGLASLGGTNIGAPGDLSTYFGVRRETVGGRNPVSSTLRKLANFCAIIEALDEIKEAVDIYGVHPRPMDL